MLKKTLLAATAAVLVTGPAFAQDMDIVDTAVEAGSFTTLAAALEAAGLVETLKGEGPFTVFAPTDEAFAALPEGTVESLLEPENQDQLASILTYHVGRPLRWNDCRDRSGSGSHDQHRRLGDGQ